MHDLRWEGLAELSAGCDVRAAILNLFGGILIQKRRAELALLESGLNYVIVRPGGMERPTDTYKRTHNVTLGAQDTLFGGQVAPASHLWISAAMPQEPHSLWLCQSSGS